MPLTRFPNGLTVNSTTSLSYTTAAGDGAIDCNNLYVAGISSVATQIMTNATVATLTATTLNVTSAGRFSISTSTAATFIGERVYIPFTFTSATATTYLVNPVAGNVVDCWVLADTTPRVCSAFTLYANGTAGSVCVASVALTFSTVIGQQVQPTLTGAVQGVATGLAIVVTTAGSACNFSGMIVVQRST